ncbi:HK97-gp10 family putative phage morphogenesis protein [Ornithinibacillus sp. 4-3]|uniref:HK97-gp10 family putative phage morphogenesis protein n=1 Tax=Ornithinibacillus sp. 4-3 TaxID=3231488 RepID=A0AB39HML1_9BACI
MKLNVVGMEDLLSSFAKMEGPTLQRIEREAVQAGAKHVQRIQERNWNRSYKSGEHVKDAITIGRAFETEEGTAINVGPKMSLRWRAKFVEYGTSRQAPQAPVAKSGQQAELIATNAMIRVLERVVK